MKKKKINKKLPKYEFGTFKKLPAGYQQANGLGDSTFNVLQGVGIKSDVDAMRKGQTAYATAKFGDGAKYLLPALLNMKTVTNTVTTPTFTSLSSPFIQSAGNSILPTMSYLAMRGATTAGLPTLLNTSVSLPAPTLTAGLSGSKSLGGFLAQSPATQLSGTANAANTTNLVPSNVTSTTTSHVLNTAGKVAAGLGIAHSVGDALFNTIPGASLHRTASDMDDTISRSTHTTAGGNTYTTYGNPDLKSELEYGKQLATQSRLGLASDVAGTVSSALALSGVGAPLSLISYPLAFAATFGLGSLFGFGDNSDEIEHEARKLADVNAGRNRMNQSVAESKDIEMGRAANGKMPGFHNGKANARVSNGEVVGNFEDGYFRVPGGKNNKDTIKTHLGKEDFVISNKHGLSDYAWLTGDIPGALAALSYLQKTGQMNKYKNGRLPKFDDGTKRRWSDAIFSMIPHGISAALNLTQLLRAQNADIYAPDFYVENPEGARAVNTLASLRFDADPYYREAQRGLNQANWDARRLVGLGIGGRAIMQNANYAQYLNGLRDITKTYNEANNAYKEKYANALANLGATNQGRRMQAAAQRHQFLQQANAARENWMAQYRKNIDQNLLNAASEYMKWGQYNDSLGIQNKMLELYDRQAKTDELKANAYINSLNGNNKTTAASVGIPLSYMVNMAKTPLSKYGFAPGILEAINRTPTVKYKNGKMPKYEDGLVDTRSDTTYQGYNPNPIPWGAGLDAAGQGPLELLSMFDIPSTTKNPYLLTGMAPTPNKWADIQKVLAARKAAAMAKTIKQTKPRKGFYEGLSDAEIQIKRLRMTEIGKKGGAASVEARKESPVVLSNSIAAERKRKLEGLRAANRQVKKLKPESRPTIYNNTKRTYNTGALTVNDFE